MKETAKIDIEYAFYTASNKKGGDLDEPLLWFICREKGESWTGTCKTNACVLFLLQGTLQITPSKHGKITLTDDQFIFLPKGHSLKFVSSTASKYILLNFRRKSLSCGKIRLGEDVRQEIERCDFPILDTPPLMSYSLEIMESVNNIIKDDEYQIAKEHELWALFWQCFPRHKVAWFLQAAINPDEEFKIFVESHFVPTKTVGQIAIEAKMCEDNFRKLFQMYFNMLPSDWITQKRISKMTTMVEKKEVNIKQIMAELGFKSVTSFNKFCNSKFGCTPSVAIKNMRQSNESI